ncbi:MAG: DUF4251 domain-containing protein [Odoribacteraceae bacterium]|jgi:hypothetical protein|nr:DUF4251 domain-containing protein [Odoribacteraceae bacterium]
MNTLRCILAASALLVCLTSAASERKKEKTDTTAFGRIATLVKNKTFRVEVTDAYPTGNSSVTISSPGGGSTTLGGEGHVSLSGNRGELLFQDSVVTGRLPFFGRGYTLPYGEGGGFEFSRSRLDKTTVKIVKKRRQQLARLSCSTRAGNDVISLTLDVYENGRCTLHVNSNNRASISYGGFVEALVADLP